MDDTRPDADNTDNTQDLSAMSDEELDAMETDLVSQFDAADEADDLDAMTAAADQIDLVRAEKERRSGASDEGVPEEIVASAAVIEDAPVAETTEEVEVDTEQQPEVEQEAQVEGEQPEVEVTEPTAEETEPVEGEETEAPNDEQDPEAETSADDNNDSPQEEAVSEIPEDRQPVVTEPVASNTIVAGADVPGVSAGMEFRDRQSLNDAFVSRIDSISNARGGDGEQFIVASIRTSAPESRTLDRSDVAGNLAKIDEVTRKEAIVASGGYCAPLETRYDIFGTGTTARPVRDALAGFQANRGGIRFTASPKITDYADAIGLWTAANDAAPSAPATKPCLTVACSPEQTATLDAITLCLQFGNLMTRAYPELVDRHNQLALVAHARFAERTLLAKLTALSTAVTSSLVLGTARDFLNAIGRAAASYRNRYRMDADESLRVIAPAWVLDAMREDLAYQMPGDDTLAVADSVIEGYLSARNVNVSWHLDGTGFSDEVDASTLDGFPASFDWHIFAEGAFLFLDGGTLDIGVVRDSTLVGTNDYKTFTETFEGVARIGAESIKVTTTTKVAGASAGTFNTLA